MSKTIDRFVLSNVIHARLFDLLNEGGLTSNCHAVPDRDALDAIHEAEELLKINRALAEGKSQLRISAGTKQ